MNRLTHAALAVLLLLTTYVATGQVDTSRIKTIRTDYPKEIISCEPCKRLWLANNGGKLQLKAMVTLQKYNGNQDLQAIIANETPTMRITDWQELTRVISVEDFVLKLGIKPGDTFFVELNQNTTTDDNLPYYVVYAPNGQLPAGTTVLYDKDNKLFLCSGAVKRSAILLTEKLTKKQ